MKKLIKKLCILSIFTVTPLTLTCFNKPTFAIKSSLNEHTKKALIDYLNNAEHIAQKINELSITPHIRLYQTLATFKDIICNIKNLKTISINLIPIFPDLADPFNEMLEIFINLSNVLFEKLEEYNKQILKTIDTNYKYFKNLSNILSKKIEKHNKKVKKTDDNYAYFEKMNNLFDQFSNEIKNYNIILSQFFNSPNKLSEDLKLQNETLKELINSLDKNIDELKKFDENFKISLHNPDLH